MSDAQRLVNALNRVARSPGFSNRQARATARLDDRFDAMATKARNADFNAEVDGCESFVMKDGSVCEWLSARQVFLARSAK